MNMAKYTNVKSVSYKKDSIAKEKMDRNFGHQGGGGPTLN